MLVVALHPSNNYILLETQHVLLYALENNIMLKTKYGSLLLFYALATSISCSRENVYLLPFYNLEISTS